MITTGTRTMPPNCDSFLPFSLPRRLFSNTVQAQVAIINFPLTAERAAEVVAWTFGEVSATATFLFVDPRESSTSIFRITPPSYTCATCAFSAGFALTSLTARYIGDASEIASTPFTFWAPPSVTSARFDSSGTRIIMDFDQATNRAGFGPSDRDCSRCASFSFSSSTTLLTALHVFCSQFCMEQYPAKLFVALQNGQMEHI
jgi:hypothetical protein